MIDVKHGSLIITCDKCGNTNKKYPDGWHRIDSKDVCNNCYVGNTAQQVVEPIKRKRGRPRKVPSTE